MPSRLQSWLDEHEDEFTIGDGDLISDPGKFESEPIYTPYYYEMTLDGGGDETLYDGESPIDIFFMDEEEWAEFDFADDIYCIAYSEDGNGFAHAEQLTKDEYDRLVDAINKSDDEEEAGWKGMSDTVDAKAFNKQGEDF